MRVHLVNSSNLSFGTAVITPRWLYVVAAATRDRFGTPIIVDETLEPFDDREVAPGDVVGIGIHTANVLRGYEVARLAFLLISKLYRRCARIPASPPTAPASRNRRGARAGWRRLRDACSSHRRCPIWRIPRDQRRLRPMPDALRCGSSRS